VRADHGYTVAGDECALGRAVWWRDEHIVRRRRVTSPVGPDVAAPVMARTWSASLEPQLSSVSNGPQLIAEAIFHACATEGFCLF
jgi:hypothetical protein